MKLYKRCCLLKSVSTSVEQYKNVYVEKITEKSVQCLMTLKFKKFRS